MRRRRRGEALSRTTLIGNWHPRFYEASPNLMWKYANSANPLLIASIEFNRNGCSSLPLFSLFTRERHTILLGTIELENNRCLSLSVHDSPMFHEGKKGWGKGRGKRKERRWKVSSGSKEGRKRGLLLRCFMLKVAEGLLQWINLFKGSWISRLDARRLPTPSTPSLLPLRCPFFFSTQHASSNDL